MEAVKKYQWKKGEHIGKVVEVKESDDTLTYFTDDTQILNSAIAEFLEGFIDGEMPFPGMADMINGVHKSISAESSGKGSVIPSNTDKVQEKSLELTNDSIESPLIGLIDKLSKKNFEAIDSKLNINIPNKNVFNMLLDNGDESREDLLEAVTQNAIKQIDINKLQEFLTIETTKFITKYYER